MRTWLLIALAAGGCGKWEFDARTEPAEGGVAVVAQCKKVRAVAAEGQQADCSSGTARVVVPYAKLSPPKNGPWQVPVRYCPGDQCFDTKVRVEPWLLPEGAVARAGGGADQLPLTGPYAVVASWVDEGPGAPLAVDGMLGTFAKVGGGTNGEPPSVNLASAPGARIEIAGKPLPADIIPGWQRWNIALRELVPAADTSGLAGPDPVLVVPVRVTPAGKPPREGVVRIRGSQIGDAIVDWVAPLAKGQKLALPADAAHAGTLLTAPGGWRPLIYWSGPKQRLGDVGEVAIGKWADPRPGGACKFATVGARDPVRVPRDYQDLAVDRYDPRDGAALGHATIAPAQPACPQQRTLDEGRIVQKADADDVAHWLEGKR